MVSILLFLGCMVVCSLNAVDCIVLEQVSPCGATRQVDLDCVRNHLLTHAAATPVSEGNNLDPYRSRDHHVFFPTFNITLFKRNNIYEGLSNTIVEEFIVDYENNLTIIYLNHKKVKSYGQLELFFHQPWQSSLKVSTNFQDEFDNYYTTTLIPGTKLLNLSHRQTHPFINNYSVNFGDENLEALMAENTVVANGVTALRNNIATGLPDIHFTVSKIIADGYIGGNLCVLPGPEPFSAVEPNVL